MRKKEFTAADLFCGAGGFTTGAQAAGVKVVLAINHWRTAIYAHQQNHPDKQIGNAVCPPVARAICQTLMEAA